MGWVWKHMNHAKTKKNIFKFAKQMGASASTKKNLQWFFENISSSDKLKKTEFELSFKVKDNILNKGEVRLLNIDAGVYSYNNSLSFLERLLFYKKLIWHKNECRRKKDVFKALELAAQTPVDLYGGADFFKEKISFAFWLILGGVEKSGKIKFIKDSDVLMKNIFSALRIKPSFAVDPSDVLNIGFDLEERDSFYKIYYILNEKTEKFINKNEQDVVGQLTRFLDGKARHWFFVSERYKIGDENVDPGRKKIYLEFLDPIYTYKDESYVMLEEIFKIIGCPCNKSLLEKYLGSIEGKVIIIAFEDDGTVTFYVRV